MQKKALLIVLDSVGCGDAPDAPEYGDAGANTLGHLLEEYSELKLENLFRLGLGRLLDLERQDKVNFINSSDCYRLTESSVGKDTTTGHWELMGQVIDEGFYTCDKFPACLVAKLEARVGIGFIGNRASSGTVILEEMGTEHVRTGHPILYTSADSVMQIAAHEEVFGLAELYKVCEEARKLLDEEGFRVGRVIARPFIGNTKDGFKRTGNRHDYSLMPDATVLNRLESNGVKVTGVGKISDIFAGSGISKSYPTKSNREGMQKIDELWRGGTDGDEFIFANLVDFDSLFGHRRDPKGYAACLEEFDKWLGSFLTTIETSSLVIITADHGNDPFHTGTDHTREQVPCFVISKDFRPEEQFSVFSDVGKFIEKYFSLK
ncbi:phosphopentomutase [Luteolibacter sp. AS25]|uniref:phosphopentomutase n=1 Tax=Luteolibacter sp. AS25 TaxID=3135776 RepID=UPI00398ADCC5